MRSLFARTPPSHPRTISTIPPTIHTTTNTHIHTQLVAPTKRAQPQHPQHKSNFTHATRWPNQTSPPTPKQLKLHTQLAGPYETIGAGLNSNPTHNSLHRATHGQHTKPNVQKLSSDHPQQAAQHATTTKNHHPTKHTPDCHTPTVPSKTSSPYLSHQ